MMRIPALANPRTGRPSVVTWIALIVIAVAISSVSIPINATYFRVPVALALLFGIAQSASIPLAIRRPQLALATSLVALIGLTLFSTGSFGLSWPWSVTSLIAQTLVIAAITIVGSWKITKIAWFSSIAASILVVAVSPAHYASLNESVVSILLFATISGVVLGITLQLIQWQNIRAELTQERQLTAAEQARRELIEERSRIARELHDVVAHGMSVIQVQATSAKYRLPQIDKDVAAEFDSIGATARGALQEMRQLLGVLRSAEGTNDTNGTIELGPQPTLEDIPALIETSRRAGVPVSLDWQVSSATIAIPGTVALTAYRIVQESLSNVVRHAPGAETTVTINAGAEWVDVLISNHAATSEVTTHDTGGHGLIGMRERVQLVGGSLSHGPNESGGYLVQARLPIPR